jgi:hypothetical protein
MIVGFADIGGIVDHQSPLNFYIGRGKTCS